MKKVLDIADKELVTPRGLRTLSPGNPCIRVPVTGTRNRVTKLITRGQYGHGSSDPFAKDG